MQASPEPAQVDAELTLEQAKKAERRQRLVASNLTELAVEFGTDKWGVHRYTPHYERHLSTCAARGSSCSRSASAATPASAAQRRLAEDVALVLPEGDDRGPRHRGQVVAHQGPHPCLRRRPDRCRDPAAHHRGAGRATGRHRRRQPHPGPRARPFAILFPLLPDGAIYCIEDIQTSYWPAWGGAVDPQAGGTSMDLVKDLVDGLNHEEFLVEGYEPSLHRQGVRAVHCYHNLVVIEKGDNVEGTNRDTAAHSLPRQSTPTLRRPHERPAGHLRRHARRRARVSRRSTRSWPIAASTSRGC